MVGNPEDWSSRIEAHMTFDLTKICLTPSWCIELYSYGICWNIYGKELLIAKCFVFV